MIPFKTHSLFLGKLYLPEYKLLLHWFTLLQQCLNVGFDVARTVSQSQRVCICHITEAESD